MLTLAGRLYAAPRCPVAIRLMAAPLPVIIHLQHLVIHLQQLAAALDNQPRVGPLQQHLPLAITIAAVVPTSSPPQTLMHF